MRSFQNWVPVNEVNYFVFSFNHHLNDFVTVDVMCGKSASYSQMSQIKKIMTIILEIQAFFNRLRFIFNSVLRNSKNNYFFEKLGVAHSFLSQESWFAYVLS